MNTNQTEIVFILDRSGSMAGLESVTIGGFNAMVEKQKKEQGDAVLSAVLFSNDNTVIYDRADIRNVEPLTDSQYFVGGSTALLDAIGGAVHHIGNVHKYAREEDRPGDQRLTDGSLRRRDIHEPRRHHVLPGGRRHAGHHRAVRPGLRRRLSGRPRGT